MFTRIFDLHRRAEREEEEEYMMQVEQTNEVSEESATMPMRDKDDNDDTYMLPRSDFDLTFPLLADVQKKIKEEIKLPTALNDKDKNSALKLSQDKLFVEHQSRSFSSATDASIKANAPLHPFSKVGYFEITISSVGYEGVVAIGLAEKSYPSNKQPGWKNLSYAYHGDDGRKFHNRASGLPYGPKFSTGDTVGCGLIFSKREIFFTKNGVILGKAFDNVPTNVDLYPIIGLDKAKAAVNFGAEPFKFKKLSLLIEEEKAREQRSIEAIDSIGLDTVRSLVRSYLIHHGYADTLAKLDNGIADKSPPGAVTTESKRDSYELALRKELIRKVMNGDAASALEQLRTGFPDFLLLFERTHMLLECQHFIEVIKQKRTQEAIDLAQNILSQFLTASDDALLNDVVGLLAYESPADSPLAHLLGEQQREEVAQELNRSLLVYLGSKPISNLEKLFKQLALTYETLYMLPTQEPDE